MLGQDGACDIGLALNADDQDINKSRISVMRRYWKRSYWILPALLAAAIVLRASILASKVLVWADEFLSWYPVSGSFGTMLAATTDTINSAPPLYFVLAWCWCHFGGGSPLALRLLSAFAMASVVITMFAVLRRVYGVLPSILALTVMCADPHILDQSSEARFHALVIAELAFAILILQRLLKRPFSNALLALNVVAHGCMVLTSYIALVYSSALLGSVLLVGLIRRKNFARIWLSIAASWVVLLPWIPVLIRHIEMSKPGWVPAATPAILRNYLMAHVTIQFQWFVLIVVGSIAISVLMGLCFGVRPRRKGLRRGEQSLLAIGLALLAVTFVIYAVSVRPGAISLFNHRYLLGTTLGWTILLAHFGHRAFLIRPPLRLRRLRMALVAAQVIITILFLGNNVRSLVRQARQYPAEALANDLATQLPDEEPIVVENIHEFLSWHYYSTRRARYRFLVDAEVGRKEMGGGPLNHAIMGALRRRFPAQFQEVMASTEFLDRACSFYVRHSPGLQWSVIRIESNPNFTVEKIPHNETLLHVRRVAYGESTPLDTEMSNH